MVPQIHRRKTDVIACAISSIPFFMSVGLFLHSGLGGLIWRMVRRERKMSGKEKKSLVAAVMIAVAYFMVYALLAWGPWNIVRGVTGRYVDSPLHDGALCILAIGIGVTSMVYGYSADHYRSDTDVVKGMSYMFSRFPSYLVSLFLSYSLWWLSNTAAFLYVLV